ncbi:MAG: hypothetical protein JXB62_12230 [Pirellulales bacterium]|nr:hypothetical protein [Pirellulales bacterium]
MPDRGSVYLGGVQRAATGRNEFGVPLLPFRPFRNSAIGSERSVSSLHVTATIHDFEAMDAYLLGQPTTLSRSLSRQPSRAAIAADGKTRQARNPAFGRSWGPASSTGAEALSSTSPAEARAHRLQQREARNQEAASLFERGQKAEAGGKANVAKIYYQMAARKASGQLEAQILARLQAIGLAQVPARLAQNGP